MHTRGYKDAVIFNQIPQARGKGEGRTGKSTADTGDIEAGKNITSHIIDNSRARILGE